MAECNTNCVMEERIKRLEEENRELREKQSETNMQSLKHDLNIKQILVKLDELDHKLQSILDEPKKQTDIFKNAIISAIGSFIGTGVIGLIVYSALMNLP